MLPYALTHTRTRQRTLTTLGIAVCCVSPYPAEFILVEVEFDAVIILRPRFPMLPLAELSLDFSLDCGGRGDGWSSIQVCDLDTSSGGAGAVIPFSRVSFPLYGESCMRGDGRAHEVCGPFRVVLEGRNCSNASSVDLACLEERSGERESANGLQSKPQPNYMLCVCRHAGERSRHPCQRAALLVKPFCLRYWESGAGGAFTTISTNTKQKLMKSREVFASSGDPIYRLFLVSHIVSPS